MVNTPIVETVERPLRENPKSQPRSLPLRIGTKLASDTPLDEFRHYRLPEELLREIVSGKLIATDIYFCHDPGNMLLDQIKPHNSFDLSNVRIAYEYHGDPGFPLLQHIQSLSLVLPVVDPVSFTHVIVASGDYVIAILKANPCVKARRVNFTFVVENGRFIAQSTLGDM